MKSRYPRTPKVPNYLKPPKDDYQSHIMTSYERSRIEQIGIAIRDKLIITFWYEDTTKKHADWRVVEPHLIGLTNYKKENIWLVGWFMPAQHQRIQGYIPDWKNYVLGNITKLTISDKRFNTRPSFNRFDERMQQVYCSV